LPIFGIARTATFEEAHDLMVEVLRAVERELPRSKVFVHGDPVGPQENSATQ
jgi:divalent metal cation (Fe/Co/Zn/Cd) transporter